MGRADRACPEQPHRVIPDRAGLARLDTTLFCHRGLQGTFSCNAAVGPSPGDVGTHAIKAKGTSSGYAAEGLFLLTS
jgi:hypothetical protein